MPSILIVLAAISVVVGFIGMNSEVVVKTAVALYDILGFFGLHVVGLVLVLYFAHLLISGFLAGISAFIILDMLGSSSFYSQGSYFDSIREPALTVLIFSALAIAAIQISKKLEYENERLLIIFSRTGLIVINMGLWIGSILGSKFGSEGRISADVFCVVWALGVLGVVFWGAKERRRFVVNTAAVFGSIHFYTQWFERLGASPGSLFFQEF